MRILIAEDDPTSHKILKTILEKWDYEVISTFNGKEALKVLMSEESPDIAILDWMMPGMDGVEVVKKVKSEKKRDVPVYIIMLTALADKSKIVEGLNAGADDYVTKPYDREELLARLNVGKRMIELQKELVQKIKELQDALDHIRTLQGIIPICSICHKIRTDADSWEKLEKYVEDHSDAQFSHGICPDCMAKYYGDYIEKDENKDKK
mgnify:FL=1